MWRIFVVSYRCCALAASGHAAAAPLSIVMKSRRFICCSRLKRSYRNGED
jgi:gluconate kinase